MKRTSQPQLKIEWLVLPYTTTRTAHAFANDAPASACKRVANLETLSPKTSLDAFCVLCVRALGRLPTPS
jgi:hypothetical protein